MIDALPSAAFGILLGCAAGLVPGLHANTLVALLAVATSNPILLVALAGSHSLVSLLPSTYLGIPAEAGHLGMLPSHRMVLAGNGSEALRAAATAALAATLLSILLLLPFKWWWLQPGNAAHFVPWFLPVVLVGAPAWLAWQERRKGRRAMAWGLAVFALAGILGIATQRLIAQALLPIPASPLGALLSGLFGGAGLVAASLGNRVVPAQHAYRLAPKTTRNRARATFAGVLASAATALIPGATPAVVATATPEARDDGAAVASLAAVGAAQPVFAVALLWLNGQARSGIALGIEATAPIQPWGSGRAPGLLLAVLATWLAAATVGYAIAHALDRPVANWLPRIRQKILSGTAFVLLALFAVLVSGSLGLLLFAAGTVTGLAPLAAGVRRVHLTGSLLLPLALG